MNLDNEDLIVKKNLPTVPVVTCHLFQANIRRTK
jgi:hypothetical protein